jgi:hypothetical protein
MWQMQDRMEETTDQSRTFGIKVLLVAAADDLFIAFLVQCLGTAKKSNPYETRHHVSTN